MPDPAKPRTLNTAIRNHRLDLAAHVIVYSTLNVAKNGGRPYAKTQKKARRP